MYQLNVSLEGQERIVLTKNNRVTIIPVNPNCPEYQEYLAWLAEGNEPLPTDDPS